MRTVLNLLPGAMAFWSRDCLSCMLNSQATQLLGFSEIDFRKDPSIWINRIDPRDRAPFSAACEKLQGGEKMVSCDYRFSPNGSEQEIWLRDVSVSHQNMLGEVGGFISTYTDISDLKGRRLQSGRNGKDEDLAGVIDGVVHEIHNNLQIILSEIDLMPYSGEAPQQFKPLVAGGVERISKLTQQLRDYFLPTDSQFSMEDPGVILGGVVREMEKELDLQGVHLRMPRGASLPRVRLDSRQFRRALGQVVEFSRALLPQGGELDIEAGLHEVGRRRYVKIQLVSSSATSLDVEERDIFRPFLRVNGHQVGLSIVMAHQILRRQNGEIFFQKENPKRAVFTILLDAM